MLGDGIAQRRMEGAVGDTVDAVDVAEVLLRSIRPDLDESAPARATTAPTPPE
jgi:hypothetical protein